MHVEMMRKISWRHWLINLSVSLLMLLLETSSGVSTLLNPWKMNNLLDVWIIVFWYVKNVFDGQCGRFGPWCYCSWVWIKQGFRLYHCEKFLGTNMEGGEKGYIRMNTGKPGVSVESIRCFLPHQTEVVISFYPICIWSLS